MEFERKSSNVAKAGLTTGIIGTSLGALGVLGNGLFTNHGNGCCNGPVCNEDHLVDRYTLELEQKNARLETEKSLLEAEKHTDKKSLELYQFFDGQLRQVRDELCKQAVQNQKTADSFQMVSERMSAMGKDLDSKITQECKERKCADNTIVTYANATFYPIEVAEVATEKTSYRQHTYNPLPAEGCGCGC